MGAKFFIGLMVGVMVIGQTLVFQPASAADPDPLQDFNSGANDHDQFTVRDVFKNGDVSHGPGGTRAALDINIFPAMKSQGITYVQFKMVPCGINLPHTHPRASEMLTLISGGPLQAGFVDTNGVAHITMLHPGDVTIFPRGMLHFELNLGTETAFYISALDSQNPGTLTSGAALFQLPAVTLATALNQTVKTINALNSTIYSYGPSLQKSSVSGCEPGKYSSTY